jgi:ribosomal protein S18 acetylase RimI-like enzyme
MSMATSMSFDPVPYLRQMQASQASALRATSECVEVGPFLAAFDRASDLVWLNYAIPVAEAATEGELREALGPLLPLFAERQRVLRFEFSQTLWPALEGVLLAAGLVCQVRVPLMIYVPSDPEQLLPAPDVELIDASASDALLMAILELRNRSFSTVPLPVPTPVEVDHLRQMIADQQLHQAVAYCEGTLAGIGSMMAGGPVSELVGVAVDPTFRRRGIASAVSRCLVGDHLARGGEAVWLSAADAVAEQVYAKIGFRTLGMQLCYIAAEGQTK